MKEPEIFSITEIVGDNPKKYALTRNEKMIKENPALCIKKISCNKSSEGLQYIGVSHTDKIMFKVFASTVNVSYVSNPKN